MDLLALVEETVVGAVLDEVAARAAVDGAIGLVEAGEGSLEIAVSGEGGLKLEGVWNHRPWIGLYIYMYIEFD